MLAAASSKAPQAPCMWSGFGGNLTLPASSYTLRTAATPCLRSYPVHLWYDGEGGRLRLDVYGGLDSAIQVRARGGPGLHDNRVALRFSARQAVCRATYASSTDDADSHWYISYGTLTIQLPSLHPASRPTRTPCTRCTPASMSRPVTWPTRRQDPPVWVLACSLTR
jgi:hypothetical protein